VFKDVLALVSSNAGTAFIEIELVVLLAMIECRFLLCITFTSIVDVRSIISVISIIVCGFCAGAVAIASDFRAV
jgi:hypothetical protein